MADTTRVSSGVPGLDRLLGGGFLPGTLVALVGAAGIGKTQFAVQFAHAGLAAEGRRGIVFDMTCRGDAQSHAPYAERIAGWRLTPVAAGRRPDLQGFFATDRGHGDYLHVFDYHGRRVTRADLGFEDWQDWQAELAAKLETTIAFFYGNFLQGVRRAVIDGIEPVDRPSESIQLELFEYVYHQILRKDPEWVARDLFRERFRAQAADEAARRRYDPGQVTCVASLTSRETMLDDLAGRRLDEGDLLTNANTVLYLGKVRDGMRIGRALYVAKHRGSAASDELVPYAIGDSGLVVG